MFHVCIVLATILSSRGPWTIESVRAGDLIGRSRRLEGVLGNDQQGPGHRRGPGGDLLAANLLRGHVEIRPHRLVGGCNALGGDDRRQAEVAQLELTVAGDQEIAGLDVAMDDAPFMRAGPPIFSPCV